MIKNLMLLFLIFQTNRTANYVGEELSYRMSYMNLPAGTLNFDVLDIQTKDTLAVYRLLVAAKTNKIFSPLFGIQNHYESYLETRTFLPVILEKDIRQKNIQQRFTIHFNHSKHIASVGDSIFWSIPDSCHHFFSMLYFLRNQALKPGDSLVFNLDAENLPSRGKAIIGEKQELTVPAGKFQAIEMNIKFKRLSSKPRPWKTDLLTNRLANPDSEIKIWLSDDHYRLPLKVQFKQIDFDVKLVLKDYRLPGGN